MLIDLKRWLTNFDYTKKNRETGFFSVENIINEMFEIKVEFVLINQCQSTSCDLFLNNNANKNPFQWKMWSKFIIFPHC